MPEPLKLLAFATPDGAEHGLALGGGRLAAGPDVAARLADLAQEADARDPLLARASDGLGIVTGTVARPERGESLRLAIAVFPGGRILAVTALRPRRAKGHDRDVIDAVVLEDGVLQPVDDPRLSVTLDGGGSPRRIGLELWLAPPDPESEDPAYAGYPRRAAGEADGPLQPLDGEPELRTAAQPVRWRSRGDAGFGWFVRSEPA